MRDNLGGGGHDTELNTPGVSVWQQLAQEQTYLFNDISPNDKVT